MSSHATLIDALDEQIALTQKEILEEIRQRTVFLTDLRAKRNSFLPVSRLPPETLAIIFIHGAHDYYESDNGGRLTPCIPTWVNVSYVCSHWRNIALNCPILWTYHFTKSPRWTEELLLRSKQASLKISYTYGSLSWWKSLRDNLLKHSERIQELRLDVPPSFLPAKLSLCVPRIEKLDISLQWGIPDQSITITDGDKLPLHTLKLANCSLSWCSFNLTGLTTLILHDVRSPSPPNIIEFLSVLNSMQNLTLLDLERVLPSAQGFLSSGGLSYSPKINLPRLALLAVIAPLSAIVALLSCVNIPQKTYLILEPLVEDGSTVGDYAPISSFLAQQFSQQSSGPVFCSLLLDVCFLDSLTLTLNCEPPLFNEVGYNIPLRITIGEVEDEDTEEMELTDSSAHRIIRDICYSLPLANIQHLHVLRPCQLSSNIWKEILGRLDGLRYMKLSCGRMPDLSLLSLVARESDENAGGQPIPDQDMTSGHMFVPALEELKLYRITFAPDHTAWEGGMSQKSLFHCLSTRKGLRDRLTMIKCNFNRTDDCSP